MKPVWLLPACLLAACASVHGKTDHGPAPHTAATAGTAGATARSVLGMLQRRGKTLHDFSADLELITSHPRTGEADEDTGKVWYFRHGKVTRFAIHFDKLIVDGAVAEAHARHDIVFDGRWLIDRNARAHIFRKTELVPPGKMYNPLKLGEGPVPIPIGQSRRRVLHDFVVTRVITQRARRVGHGKARPLVHLRLVPRKKNMYRFKRMDIWVDTHLQLPVKVVRTGADGSTTTAILKHPRINAGVPHIFHLKTPSSDSGWTVIVQPWRHRTR